MVRETTWGNRLSRRDAARVSIVGIAPGEAARIRDLLEPMGFEVLPEDPAPIWSSPPEPPACVVAEMLLGGGSGLELLSRLRVRASCVPVVFVTVHGEMSMAVEAMKQGAVDVLKSPVVASSLIDAVQRAIAWSTQRVRDQESFADLQVRFESLTTREREVMDLVIEGLASKRIASRLSISKKTVDLHRANLMRKAGAESLVDLVRVVMKLEELSKKTSNKSLFGKSRGGPDL